MEKETYDPTVVSDKLQSRLRRRRQLANRANEIMNPSF